MTHLLDTDTVIYWLKGNRNVSSKAVSIGFHALAISDLTKAELYYGAYKSHRVEDNLAAIQNLAERVIFLPFNDSAQMIFGEVKALLEKEGKRLDDIDLMIAATAQAFGLVLVSNNVNHFERIPSLRIENWI